MLTLYVYVYMYIYIYIYIYISSLCLLQRERIAVCCNNHTKHYTVWVKCRVFSVKAASSHPSRWTVPSNANTDTSDCHVTPSSEKVD